ncbi:hypothetical protein EGR_10907 [Echinococcus granulosus]|uniref:Uncharacterized protein n=1 Tax=Echinococcus granulosus TaxID=6210 RepID=W6TZR1_ECHGR|nr:hypothetical protein EGR_10907 [Echinococcus granulosus]EUB54233.1 hypothetical protein EGR_10907 [Echinococcus granulosus]
MCMCKLLIDLLENVVPFEEIILFVVVLIPFPQCEVTVEYRVRSDHHEETQHGIFKHSDNVLFACAFSLPFGQITSEDIRQSCLHYTMQICEIITQNASTPLGALLLTIEKAIMKHALGRCSAFTWRLFQVRFGLLLSCKKLCDSTISGFKTQFYQSHKLWFELQVAHDVSEVSSVLCVRNAVRRMCGVGPCLHMWICFSGYGLGDVQYQCKEKNGQNNWFAWSFFLVLQLQAEGNHFEVASVTGQQFSCIVPKFADWWTYELCMGKEVLQHHKDKDCIVSSTKPRNACRCLRLENCSIWIVHNRCINFVKTVGNNFDLINNTLPDMTFLQLTSVAANFAERGCGSVSSFV